MAHDAPCDCWCSRGPTRFASYGLVITTIPPQQQLVDCETGETFLASDPRAMDYTIVTECP